MDQGRVYKKHQGHIKLAQNPKPDSFQDHVAYGGV